MSVNMASWKPFRTLISWCKLCVPKIEPRGASLRTVGGRGGKKSPIVQKVLLHLSPVMDATVLRLREPQSLIQATPITVCLAGWYCQVTVHVCVCLWCLSGCLVIGPGPAVWGIAGWRLRVNATFHPDKKALPLVAWELVVGINWDKMHPQANFESWLR